jgi:hypothetical protein
MNDGKYLLLCGGVGAVSVACTLVNSSQGSASRIVCALLPATGIFNMVTGNFSIPARRRHVQELPAIRVKFYSQALPQTSGNSAPA